MIDSEYKNDKFEEKEKGDNFIIKRFFKFLLLFLVSVVFIVLVVLFVRKLIFDSSFQDNLLSKIVQELSTIVISALVILGFKPLK